MNDWLLPMLCGFIYALIGVIVGFLIGKNK